MPRSHSDITETFPALKAGANQNFHEEPSVETQENLKWFQAYKKPLFGFIAAMISSVMNTSANILVKKTSFFNAFDNSAIRYVFQLMILLVIAKFIHRNYYRDKQSFCDFLLGERRSLKLLIARGSISGIGQVSLYLAIKMMNPADAISVFSCNIIFIAILSWIILKEKFTILHIIALLFVICGTILITQPSFLVKYFSQDIQEISIMNITSTISPINQTEQSGFFTESVLNYIGLSLAIFASLLYASIAILIKEMSKRKIHFSVMNLYTAYFGLPLCIMLVVVAEETGYDVKDYSLVYKKEFLWEIFYSSFSSIAGTTSQIFWIISLKYEDATKIAMYRTADLLLTFLFQYFFLGIASNLFSISGALFIFFGMIIVIMYNLINKQERTKQPNVLAMKNIDLDGEDTQCFEQPDRDSVKDESG